MRIYLQHGTRASFGHVHVATLDLVADFPTGDTIMRRVA